MTFHGENEGQVLIFWVLQNYCLLNFENNVRKILISKKIPLQNFYHQIKLKFMFNSLLNVCKVLSTSEQRVWHNILIANASKRQKNNKFKISLISKNFVNKDDTIWREILNFRTTTVILLSLNILNYKNNWTSH